MLGLQTYHRTSSWTGIHSFSLDANLWCVHFGQSKVRRGSTGPLRQFASVTVNIVEDAEQDSRCRGENAERKLCVLKWHGAVDVIMRFVGDHPNQADDSKDGQQESLEAIWNVGKLPEEALRFQRSGRDRRKERREGGS